MGIADADSGERTADSRTTACQDLLVVVVVVRCFLSHPAGTVETMETASTIDQLELLLASDEAHIARIRARQLATLRALDLAQVPMADGSRSIAEWVVARMDVTPETARRLTQTAARLEDQDDLAQDLAEGVVSFDRACEESRLIATGASQDQVAVSRGFDLAGVRRMVARHRRLERRDEQQAHDARFVSMQPTLDQSAYRLWGLLGGVDGHTVEQALMDRTDRFPSLPDHKTQPRGQRLADALVSIAHDSLDGTDETNGASRTPLVSIFVDAGLAADTKGEAGVETDTGIRVGPLTLEEILCDGRVEILKTDIDGQPLTVGKTSRTIPPKLRRFILHRDGGACTADGCRSRYRLQPHHITPRSQGGSHHPSNLTTLCWFHHHVVIHRNGYRIDPDSPPQRRRFLTPNHRAPP